MRTRRDETQRAYEGVKRSLEEHFGAVSWDADGVVAVLCALYRRSKGSPVLNVAVSDVVLPSRGAR
jgi:hypothetical protein